MPDFDVVIYKPHGTKIAIGKNEFDSKVHERIVEGKVYEPEIKENQVQSLEEMSLQDLNGEFFRLGNVRATDKYRTSRTYLISRIKQMMEEQKPTEVKEPEIKNDILNQEVGPHKRLGEGACFESCCDGPVNIEDLREAYQETTGKKLSPRYMNDIEWMTKKIDEAKQK